MSETATTPRVSKADVFTALTAFVANPPSHAITMKEFYAIVGNEHRQSYEFFKNHGATEGAQDSQGRGRKAELKNFTGVTWTAPTPKARKAAAVVAPPATPARKGKDKKVAAKNTRRTAKKA